MKTKPKIIQTFLTAEEIAILDSYLQESGIDLKAWHRSLVRKAIKKLKKDSTVMSDEETKLLEQRAKKEAMIAQAFK